MRELESQAKAQAIAATSETTAQAARNAEAESRLQQLHQLMEQLTAQAAGLKSDEDAAASRVAELRIDVQMAESGAKAAATEMRAMEEQAKALTVVAESETAAQAARNVEAESRQQQLHLDMQRLITEAACLKFREDAAASRVAELQVENVTADSRGKAAEEEVARLVRHLELRNAEVESRLQKLHLDMQRLTTEATGLKGREDAAASRMAELQAESATADSRVKAAEEEGAEAERRLQQAEAECRLRSAAARAAEEDIERLTAEAADLQSREGAAVKRKDELLRANAEVLSRTKAAEGEAQQLCLQAAQLQSLEQSTARAVAEAAERQARGHLEAKEQERALAEGRLQQLLQEVDKLSTQVDGVRAREEATAKRRLELQAESAEAERRAEAAAADSAAAKARHEAAVQEGAERLRAAEEEAASLKAQADALSRKQAEAERTVAALKVCNAEAEGCVHAREQEVVSLCNEASELKAREGAAERAVEALSAAAACSPAAAEREQEAAPASAPDRDAETRRRDVVERRLKELEVSREHLAGEMEELETRAEAVAEEVRCLQARAEEAKGRLQEEEAEAALLSMRAAQQRSREETVRRVHEQASRLAAQEGELGLRELAAARRLEELKASSREAQRRALAAEREVEGLAAGYEELLQRERAASQLAEGLRAQAAELDAKLQGTEGCPSPLLQHQSVDSTRCDPCETSLGSLRNQSLEFAPLDHGDDGGLPARELPEGARSPELERSVSRTRSRMLQHLAWSHGQLAPAAAASAGGGGRRRGRSQSPARASAGHQVPRLHHLGPGASSRAEPPGPRAAAELRAAALARPRSPAGLLPAQQGPGEVVLAALCARRCAAEEVEQESGPAPCAQQSAAEQGPGEVVLAALCARRCAAEEVEQESGPAPCAQQSAAEQAEAEAPAAPREGPGEVVLAALCARRCAAEEAEEEREGVAAPSARESTAEQESGPALCARQSAAELASPAQVEQESGPAPCAQQSAAEQEPVLADGAQREQVRRVRVWVKDLHEVCRVSFEYGDGTARAFGQDGGLEQFPFVVPPGEHIVKLHSRCRHETTGTLLGTPYMHEGCCFETNQDRRSLWYGGNGGTLSTFTASDGHHITGFNTLGGLKSGVPIGIEEQTLVSMHDLACAGHLCDLTLTSIRQLAIENDSWYELQTQQELERVTTRGAAEPGQYVASFEEMRHREDMYDAVARDDQDAWENLAQGSDLARADFQRLREVWKEAAQLGSQASRTGVCEAIAEAARDNVLCLSCGGQGCGLCRARDFLSWARRRLATEVQERQEPEWTAARVAPPQVSTADRGPVCAFQHFSHQRAERAAIS
ncbi:unnamed protein product [Prorocentrum cordatum]|uniref:Jacalin-type lectin domain-containing protein n=1 Tax=Prorocentrum cordatum TaxID=2364126 RepID=A0ABN9RGL1_9DINO|nr:unnamed protein product [Polarella glacialis]